MSSNVLLISVNTIKDRTKLHCAVDEKFVLSDIKFAQDAFILPLIGSALMQKIQDGLQNNNLIAPYTTLRNDYIIDALIWYTLSETGAGLSFQMYNKGQLQQRNENTTASSGAEIVDMSQRYSDKAEFYGQKLIRYLLQNHLLFPEYDQPGNGIDTVRPKHNAYESPFYFGDEDCGCTGNPYLPVSDSKFKRNCP